MLFIYACSDEFVNCSLKNLKRHYTTYDLIHLLAKQGDNFKKINLIGICTFWFEISGDALLQWSEKQYHLT